MLIESSSPQELERLRAVIPAAPAVPSVEVHILVGEDGWGVVKGTLRESPGNHNTTLGGIIRTHKDKF